MEQIAHHLCSCGYMGPRFLFNHTNSDQALLFCIRLQVSIAASFVVTTIMSSTLYMYCNSIATQNL